jgi:predicted AAA+ superfamily ATPase
MERKSLITEIQAEFRVAKVVALLGPRQSGKTTLARHFCEVTDLPFDAGLNYFDLEDPAHLERLRNPKLALEPLRGLVVIDEIQGRPDLFGILRVLADRPGSDTRFLILGSASRDLIRQGAETLAGRIGFVEVTPFGLAESAEIERLWMRGGFPLSFLAETGQDSWRWRANYIRTFLERDIPALGIQIPPVSLRRFWTMLAHYHGQTFNASEIGKSLGAADTTVKRYLDVLTGTFMVRRLQPWFENLSKRQVKTPKIYFRDSGVLHHLLGIPDMAAMVVHPKLGASWEGFALEQIIRLSGAAEEEIYFWGVHSQGEIDLLLIRDGVRRGFEIKYTDRPAITASQTLALDSLNLDRIDIICPGAASYPLGEKVHVCGLDRAGELFGQSQSG